VPCHSRNAPQRITPRTEKVLLTGTASDSHTWNLVFLQLFIEELGHQPVNLGPCVPDRLLIRGCRIHAPALLVMSSVNGHGYRDGLSAIRRLRADPSTARLPAVIGGKLDVAGGLSADQASRLHAAGFDAVFADDDLAGFSRFVSELFAPRRRTRPHAAAGNRRAAA
jgi:methylaspartate mutase sigma subunit